MLVAGREGVEDLDGLAADVALEELAGQEEDLAEEGPLGVEVVVVEAAAAGEGAAEAVAAALGPEGRDPDRGARGVNGLVVHVHVSDLVGVGVDEGRGERAVGQDRHGRVAILVDPHSPGRRAQVGEGVHGLVAEEGVGDGVEARRDRAGLVAGGRGLVVAEATGDGGLELTDEVALAVGVPVVVHAVVAAEETERAAGQLLHVGVGQEAADQLVAAVVGAGLLLGAGGVEELREAVEGLLVAHELENDRVHVRRRALDVAVVHEGEQAHQGREEVVADVAGEDPVDGVHEVVATTLEGAQLGDLAARLILVVEHVVGDGAHVDARRGARRGRGRSARLAAASAAAVAAGEEEDTGQRQGADTGLE